MIQIAYIFVWWLILLAVGLIAFPMVSRVCHRLPDRGYSISKLLGLLLITYFSWMLSSAHIIKFGYVNIIIAILLLLALSLFLGRKHLNRGNLPLKSMLITEAIFAIAFGLFLFYLSHKPDLCLTYSEDFMDFGFLSSILRTDYFPPTDPWLAGETIPYYYGGHLISAVMTTLSRVPTAIAYNLAVAMYFALAVCVAYGLGYNVTKKKLYGFVTVLFVCIAGFISGAFQLTAYIIDKPVMGYAPLQASNIGEWFLNFGVACCWVIQSAVTHYPYYAYLVGDMHANVMDIPFQLMFITLILSLLTRGEPSGNGGRSDSLLRVFILGLCLGFFAFVNMWSYPVYLGLIVLACLLLKLNLSKKGLLGVIGLSLILYLPYYISRGSGAVAGIGVVEGRTELVEFFEIFALFSVVLMTFLFVLLWHEGFKNKLQSIYTSFKHERVLPIRAITIIAIIVIVAALVAVLCDFQLILILTPLVLIPLYCILELHTKGETQFMLLLVLMGAAVVLMTEIFYIDDPLGGEFERYNTILKMYIPIWIILAVPSAYAVFFVLGKLRGRTRQIWIFILLLFVLAALVHPIASTTGWAGGSYSHIEDGRLTLDGMAYLQDTNIGDYEAIQWLNENVDGSRVILEAPGVAMEYSSQASAFTGLPTLLGWAGWEVMWRDSWEIITERTAAIDTIYKTTDEEEATAMLKEYNVEYIYLGTLEREMYEAEGLLKFANNLDRYELVYRNPEVEIYRVLP